MLCLEAYECPAQSVASKRKFNIGSKIIRQQEQARDAEQRLDEALK